MRVFILEPSAVGIDRTHGAKALIGHTRALVSAGIEVVWVSNIKNELDYPAVPNHKIFTYTIYDDVRNKRKTLQKKLLQPIRLILARNTSRALIRVLLSENISSDDHIFVPTTDWITFRAVFMAVESPELKDRAPAMHFLIMYDRARWMTGGYPFEKITGQLRNTNRNVFVYTETARLAGRLPDQIGKPVRAYPFPGFKSAVGSTDVANKKSVCFLGGGRRDKGFQLIPDIVGKLDQEAKDLDIIVQEPRPEDRLGEELEKLKQYGNVQILDNTISEDDYNNYLHRCSILVFPYDKYVYEARGSAIVVEAVVNGVPLICTDDTSLTEMIYTGNGKAAKNADEFAHCILEINRNYEQFHDRAGLAAEKYEKNLLNSPLVKNITGRD